MDRAGARGKALQAKDSLVSIHFVSEKISVSLSLHSTTFLHQISFILPLSYEPQLHLQSITTTWELTWTGVV